MSKDFPAQKGSRPSMSAKDGEPTTTSESLTPPAWVDNEPISEVGGGGATQPVLGTVIANVGANLDERQGACL